MACRQCPKRLWLEIHRPDLRDDSGSTAAFQAGNDVGEIARSIFDPQQNGETLDITTLGHTEALRRSAELLAKGGVPVFEAGITADGGLAYADVMLPDWSAGELRWQMIEVKAATSVKPHYIDDLAIQVHLATTAGHQLASASIAHINNEFIYPGNGDYRNLLREKDLTESALQRATEVRDWISFAQDISILDSEPNIQTGPHCNSPYPCPFTTHCTSNENLPEFPLTSLHRLHAKRRILMENAGYIDLRDVPDNLLNPLQQRIKSCSISGRAEFNATAAAAAIAPYPPPIYFLDFETAQFAVPIWKGTRPYQQIPFQFSLHHLDPNEVPHHTGFLDLSGDDPSLLFAEALLDTCMNKGAIFVYNRTFEARIVTELATRFPHLTESLHSLRDRMIDLQPIAQNHFYHPNQHGSWSLKAVLPNLCPDLSYDQLDAIKDGGAAAAAYHEAISPTTPAKRKKLIHRQLHDYCHLDTFALLRMWEVFKGKRKIESQM